MAERFKFNDEEENIDENYNRTIVRSCVFM